MGRGEVAGGVLSEIYGHIGPLHVLILKKCHPIFEMRCAIWYHLYNLKNVGKTHGGALHLVKLQALVSNSTKSNTPPWVLSTLSKLYKWYQIAQGTTYICVIIRKTCLQK